MIGIYGYFSDYAAFEDSSDGHGMPSLLGVSNRCSSIITIF